MKTESVWANEIAEKIHEKTVASATRSVNKVPYLTENGIFDDWSDRISWWTNGFYGGQLWQMYHIYGDDILKTVAENIENKLDESLMDYMGMDHDSGFKWLLTSVANYKVTGSEKSKNRALLAAANLAGRFNPAGGFLRAWNDPGDGNTAGWAIIDCMMNLPLLYWASDVTKDPRFRQIAMAHADTALRAFVREDGSVHHIVQFDPYNGEIIGPLGGQGMEIGSSWTRGQAWAIYGFTLSYIHTQEKRYLDAALRVARYFVSQVAESGFIPVDFCQDPACDWEDSTAAAIASCGMLELAKILEDCEEGKMFGGCAIKMLKVLSECRSNWDTGVDYMIENGSVAYHDEKHNFSIIYGDYFFTEAILKLCDKELFLW